MTAVTTYHGLRTEVVRYGPDVAADDDLRLLGVLQGQRVLELGSGARSSAVAMARQGATVVVVDPHPERLAETRVVAEDEEVRIEWHDADLADLAFLRGDSMDLAFSAGAVSEVEDLNRLFRQVQRVLKPGGHFVFSYEHPAMTAAHDRSYFDRRPLPVRSDGIELQAHPRPLEVVFTALVRAGFQIELLAEPEPRSPGASWPTTVIWRARKVGQ
jgi:SAM-dependent methyltransferase